MYKSVLFSVILVDVVVQIVVVLFASGSSLPTGVVVGVGNRTSDVTFIQNISVLFTIVALEIKNNNN